MRRVDRRALWGALIAYVAKGVEGRVAGARRGRSVVCVGGIGARWVRKSSGVRGSPPKDSAVDSATDGALSSNRHGVVVGGT